MDQFATTIFLFLAGLLIGSFVTVVAHRVPRGESVVGGRSHCPACGAQIAAYDNVPAFSWLRFPGFSASDLVDRGCECLQPSR